MLLAWGYNADGDLGNGTTSGSDLPVRGKLPKGTRATAVRGGAEHSLALTSNGQVLAWGDNFYSQLGNGTTVGTGPGGLRLWCPYALRLRIF